MKKITAVFAIGATLLLVSCNQNGMVNVSESGVQVDTGNSKVNVGKEGIEVNAGDNTVEIGKDGVKVNADTETEEKDSSKTSMKYASGEMTKDQYIKLLEEMVESYEESCGKNTETKTEVNAWTHEVKATTEATHKTNTSTQVNVSSDKGSNAKVKVNGNWNVEAKSGNNRVNVGNGWVKVNAGGAKINVWF